MSKIYPVNDDVLRIEEDNITAGTLKKRWGAPDDDLVYVYEPGKKRRRLNDHDYIPDGAERISIVPRGEKG